MMATKEQLSNDYSGLRGFVFKGTYGPDSLNMVSLSLQHVGITNSVPDHILEVDGGFCMLWNEDKEFDAPKFFHRCMNLTNVVLNNIELSSLFNILTVSEFLNESSN